MARARKNLDQLDYLVYLGARVTKSVKCPESPHPPPLPSAPIYISNARVRAREGKEIRSPDLALNCAVFGPKVVFSTLATDRKGSFSP